MERSDYSNPIEGLVHRWISSVELGIVKEICFIRIDTPIDTETVVYDFLKKSNYSKEDCKEVVEFWMSALPVSTREKIGGILAKTSFPESKSTDAKTFVPGKAGFLSPVIDKGIVNVNVGVGKKDFGFQIRGLRISKECYLSNQSFYAVVFNFLCRSKNITQERVPVGFIRYCEKHASTILDYGRVFRLEILILYLIRYNYLDDSCCLSLNYLGNEEELEAAFYTINHYLENIKRLAAYKGELAVSYQKVQDSPSVAINESADIVLSDLEEANPLSPKDIWWSSNIIYNIDETDKEVLSELLSEILVDRDTFRKKDFLPGQYEIIRAILNEKDISKRSSICVMPTGSGKSLIFYILSLLQPGTMMILSPTELLIKDQIRNLDVLHGIDDVEQLTSDRDYTYFTLNHKFYYITPDALQNQKLLNRLTVFNNSMCFSYVVLDEVHCISNWGHDFRPPFLMVSRYLNEQLDRTKIIGFTATANYSVVRDLMQQLNIDDPNQVYSPIQLDSNHISFRFLRCDNEAEILQKAVDFLLVSLKNNEKTLIFTKSYTSSLKLQEALDSNDIECLVFTRNDQYAYSHFASGDIKVLIADDSFGIGINLPNVTNVIHCGLPLSKGIYVQEIGRAGRNNEQSCSLVLYEKPNSQNENPKLLLRDTSTDELIRIVDGTHRDGDSDIICAYRKIFGDMKSKTEFSQRTIDLYQRLIYNPRISIPFCDINKDEKCLYILYSLGLIENWYALSKSDAGFTFFAVLPKRAPSMSESKDNARNSIFRVGSSAKNLSEIGKAGNIDDLICAYVNWYFDSYVFNHKEQFLDMIDFLESYRSKSLSDIPEVEISKRLSYYFSLSMVKMSEDRDRYLSMNYQSLAMDAMRNEAETIANIQQINSDSYDSKLDFYLFVNSVICDHKYDEARWKRILAETSSKNEILDLMEAYNLIYKRMADDETRLASFVTIRNELERRFRMGDDFFEFVFRNNAPDVVYYSFMIVKLNRMFKGE